MSGSVAWLARVAERLSVMSFGRRLAMCVGVGAVVRCALLAYRWGDDLRFNDSYFYSDQAAGLARGKWFTGLLNQGLPTAEHPPMTAVLLAPFSRFGPLTDMQRLATALFGIVTVWLIGLVGRRLAGPGVGVIAAGIAAVYPGLWINDGLIMSEGPSALTITLLLMMAVRFVDKPTAANAAWVGVCVTIAALTRSEVVLVGVICVAIALRIPATWRERAARAGAMTAAGFVCFAPWFAFNLARFDGVVLITTNGEGVLAGANCDRTYYGDLLGGWAFECVRPSGGPAGRDQPALARQRRDEAVAYIGDNTGRVPVVVAARLGRTLDLYGWRSAIDDGAGDERPRWATALAIPSFWLAATAAGFGIRRLPPRRQAVLLGPVVVVLLSSAVFYGSHRLRIAAEPVLVLGAAVQLRQLATRWAIRPGSPTSAPVA